MRNLVAGPVLQVHAIGGLHVVTLAWDFIEGQDSKKKDLMGFAVERTEFADGKEVERYFIRGIKRFQHKDEGLDPGTPVPTSEHPIQTFQWGDYTAKPVTTYEFRVVPAYGTPKLLVLDHEASTTVRITTEAEEQGPEKDGSPAHNIYFNRGVAGSQAYARKFGKKKPDEDDPDSEQMKWLSRGLFEALTGFIGLAAGKDAKDYKLRCMFYEFRYLPVAKALKAAHAKGADVAIRYEAQTYKKANETVIKSAGIKSICKPQKVRAGIRHNKFMVLIHKGEPIAVWTGSTNISAGGIFGHSNVGHSIWDKGIAERYLKYWENLADEDVTRGQLVTSDVEVESTPKLPNVPDDRILTLFSPRDQAGKVLTIQWYADLMKSARHIFCMTFAFKLAPEFGKILKMPGDTLRYAVFDKNLSAADDTAISKVQNSVIAVGAKLEKGDMELFLGEELTGFNVNRYIHDKFFLVDPLAKRPIVITGSANFSSASQTANDENMLAIAANTRVADIYFGEFMRIFDHLYSRYIVAKLKKAGKNDPNSGYLKEKTAEWLPQHFVKNSRKDLRRRYFITG